MKLYLVLSSLVISTSMVFGAEKLSQQTSDAVKRNLFFALNADKQIIEYGCRNLEFLVSPQEFLGKVLTESVPLNVASKEAINKGLMDAHNTPGHKYLVGYELFEHKFVATIEYQDINEKYFVKVRPKLEN